MPKNSKEYHKLYMREYRKTLKCQEYEKKYAKEYRQNNKEKLAEYDKEYNKTDKGLKVSRISKWRFRGLISEDIDKIYERYILTEECDNCGILLDEDEATKKCMDHCHETGQFRNILCKSCNTIRG